MAFVPAGVMVERPRTRPRPLSRILSDYSARQGSRRNTGYVGRVSNNNETLGEREAKGFVTPTFAAHLETVHGADWRMMTHHEAIARVAESIASDRRLKALTTP